MDGPGKNRCIVFVRKRLLTETVSLLDNSSGAAKHHCMLQGTARPVRLWLPKGLTSPRGQGFVCDTFSFFSIFFDIGLD